MMDWLLADMALCLLFVAQHSLLTTQQAVRFIERITRPQLWNLVFSALTVVVMAFIYLAWQPSGISIYSLEGGWYITVFGLHIFFIFMFFYCFKYTSFWQWLGVSQAWHILRGRKLPPYYKINRAGLKRYVRFPHHTFLILIFWAQPAMTLDSLLLAIAGTVYTWLGTMHQDTRGLRVLGDAWADYSKDTHILVPPLRRVLTDWWAMRRGVALQSDTE